MPIFLYNSLERKKEEFIPIKQGHAGIYVCGPTVYGPPHLGHAKSYIAFDVLVKHLRYSGFKVRYVQNITDVGHLTDDADSGEDKIQRQARIDKVHPYEIVDKYTRIYMRDMQRLHVEPPSFYVRASQHIPEQLEAVQKLLESGHAYEVNGNVYFNVESFADYGKLSGRRLDADQKEAVRVEARGEKHNPRDFALWKRAEEGHILKWNSPWGMGYPGWHIECSVMANKYLGPTIDIHGGGLENKFPHHECEIAQSECINGVRFANYWVHNNMVTVDGIKMGKSLGNFKTCEELLSKHSSEAIRAFLLTTHYRSPSNYTEEAIEAAAVGLKRLAQAQGALIEIAAKNTGANNSDPAAYKLCQESENAVTARLDDDIDTPGAIAEIYNFVSAVNKLIDAGALSSEGAKKALSLLQTFGGDILGILPPARAKSGFDLDPVMRLLLDLRAQLKAEKRYDLADSIRNRLKEAKIAIEDTKNGARWKLL